jgi:hypothetical protein
MRGVSDRPPVKLEWADQEVVELELAPEVVARVPKTIQGN